MSSDYNNDFILSDVNPERGKIVFPTYPKTSTRQPFVG